MSTKDGDGWIPPDATLKGGCCAVQAALLLVGLIVAIVRLR